MKLALRLLVPAVLLGLGVWLWIYLHPSPDEAIRRQLTKLSKVASFEKPENLIKRGIAAQDVAAFFAGEVTILINPPDIYLEQVSRAEIAQQVALLRAHPDIQKFHLTFLDPVITLGADKRSAIVELTMNAQADDDQHLVVQEVRLTMREVDGTWLICRIETVRTLNQVPVPSIPAGVWIA